MFSDILGDEQKEEVEPETMESEDDWIDIYFGESEYDFYGQILDEIMVI